MNFIDNKRPYSNSYQEENDNYNWQVNDDEFNMLKGYLKRERIVDNDNTQQDLNELWQ